MPGELKSPCSGVGDPGSGTHAWPALPLLSTFGGGAGVPGPRTDGEGAALVGGQWELGAHSAAHFRVP